MNITGSESVPQYEQCSLIVVFSNAVGSSEPFEVTLGKVNVYVCQTVHIFTTVLYLVCVCVCVCARACV